jgi:hypothetical protein
MSNTDHLQEYFLNEFLPRLRDEPDKLFETIDVELIDSYLQGFGSGLGFVLAKDPISNYGFLDIGQYSIFIGTGTEGLARYFKRKSKGNMKKALEVYLEHLERYFLEYRDNHKRIKDFPITISRSRFRRQIVRFLNSNPEFNEYHLVLNGGIRISHFDYKNVCYYHGYAINSPMNYNNPWEKEIVDQTKSILLEIGISV